MAIENQAAVRGTHRTHAHAAGASRAAAGDETGAASGFSALLGAAADDTDGLDTSLAATTTATTNAGLPGDTLTGSARKRAPADDSAGSDAAALAAWGGFLQPATVPLAATAASGATGINNTTAAASASLAGSAGPGVPGVPGAFHNQPVGMPDLPATVSPGLVAPAGAGLKTQAGALLQVDGKAPGRSTPLDVAGSLTAALATAPVDSRVYSGQSAQALQPAQATQASQASQVAPMLSQNAAAAPMAGSPIAPGAGLRPAAVSVQTAVARAHAATVAADAASGQAASLSTGVGSVAIALGASDAGTGRGTSSTVSLGEGGQGRWAGMLSDIVRPIQAESAASGFAGGASQGRENGRQGDSRGADASSGTGINGLGFAPAGAAAEGNGSFSSASTFGSDGQPLASGMVMTPDEWLAATTASINPRSLQTAELTVDAFGAPVDVTISLNGSQAEVTFQSDQADTRALLGGAVSDLQNLLQQEGLMLSGVSVGGSNAGHAGSAQGFSGDAGQGGNRDRGGEPVRITPDISVATPVAAASARSAAASARGGLDLFA